MKRLFTGFALVALACALVVCANDDNNRDAAADAGSAATSAPATTTTTIPACTVTTDTTLTRVDLDVAGTPRDALVHLPAGWDGTTAVPLVLSFHGLGSNADQQMSNDKFSALADQNGFIVAYPNAGGELGNLGAAWKLQSDDDDAPFVNALLDTLEQKVCIDPARVYATGLSYGGAMTDLVACKLPDRIAAAAPVSAYIPDQPCTSTTAVPTMAFHGVEDLLLPYEGGGNSEQVPFEALGRDDCRTQRLRGRTHRDAVRADGRTDRVHQVRRTGRPLSRPRQRPYVAGPPTRTASGGDDRFLLGQGHGRSRSR